MGLSGMVFVPPWGPRGALLELRERPWRGSWSHLERIAHRSPRGRRGLEAGPIPQRTHRNPSRRQTFVFDGRTALLSVEADVST
eukprot:7280651-Pyramimonas_sp.AAC.1